MTINRSWLTPVAAGLVSAFSGGALSASVLQFGVVGSPIRRFFGVFLYDTPHDPLRRFPKSCLAANAPKNAAFAHTSGSKPGIDGALNPIWNGHRQNVSALADQVNDGPVVLASLEMPDLKFGCLFPAQGAPQENAEEGVGLVSP